MQSPQVLLLPMANKQPNSLIAAIIIIITTKASNCYHITTTKKQTATISRINHTSIAIKRPSAARHNIKGIEKRFPNAREILLLLLLRASLINHQSNSSESSTFPLRLQWQKNLPFPYKHLHNSASLFAHCDAAPHHPNTFFAAAAAAVTIETERIRSIGIVKRIMMHLRSIVHSLRRHHEPSSIILSISIIINQSSENRPPCQKYE